MKSERLFLADNQVRKSDNIESKLASYNYYEGWTNKRPKDYDISWYQSQPHPRYLPIRSYMRFDGDEEGEGIWVLREDIEIVD